jgi:hypothetical protein
LLPRSRVVAVRMCQYRPVRVALWSLRGCIDTRRGAATHVDADQLRSLTWLPVCALVCFQLSAHASGGQRRGSWHTRLEGMAPFPFEQHVAKWLHVHVHTHIHPYFDQQKNCPIGQHAVEWLPSLLKSIPTSSSIVKNGASLLQQLFELLGKVFPLRRSALPCANRTCKSLWFLYHPSRSFRVSLNICMYIMCACRVYAFQDQRQVRLYSWILSCWCRFSWITHANQI